MRNFVKKGINLFSIAFNIVFSIPILVWSLLVVFLSKDSDFVLGCLSDEIVPDYFKEKVVWITGSSSGIGKSIAMEIAKISRKNNFPVYIILTSRNFDQLKHVKQEMIEKLGFPEQNILILAFDVGELSCIEFKVEEALKWKGRIDILYNNAGIGQKALLAKFDSDYKVFMVNALGFIKISKEVLFKCFIPQKSGHLINTLSIQAFVSLPGRCAYGATKRGCFSYFKSLRKELNGLNWAEYLEKFSRDEAEREYISESPNILITNVFPGHVETDFNSRNILEDGSTAISDLKIQGMSSERCSELIIKGTTNLLEEIWIAAGVELIFTYICYYCPNIADLIGKLTNRKFISDIWKFQKSQFKKSI